MTASQDDEEDDSGSTAALLGGSKRGSQNVNNEIEGGNMKAAGRSDLQRQECEQEQGQGQSHNQSQSQRRFIKYKTRRKKKQQSWNRNVKLALTFSFLSSAARGIWGFTTLSLYLKELSGSSAVVGVAEGIQGLCQACSAALAGIIADRFGRRDRVLHFSALIAMIAIGVLIYGLNAPEVKMDDDYRLNFIIFGLAFIGAFQGISSTSIDTLYADSVATGLRSKFNTFRFCATQLSSISGPLIVVLLFLRLGDEWTFERLKMVFTIGVCFNAIPILILFLLSDENTLGLDSESHYIPSTPGGSTRYQRLVDEVLESDNNNSNLSLSLTSNNSSNHLAFTESPFAPVRTGASSRGVSRLGGSERFQATEAAVRGRSHSADGGENSSSNNNSWSFGHDNRREQQVHVMRNDNMPSRTLSRQIRTTPVVRVRQVCGCFGQEYIPWILVVSDVISALGSGMSVKFFPLFFKEQLGLEPIAVNSIYVGLPIWMSLISIIAQKISKKIGRIQVCILCSGIGCLALFALAYVGNMNQNPSMVISIYFITTLQHCTRPLRKAVLMDYVPKRSRAKYNSVESITRLNWSGSAVLGGYSLKYGGYDRLFIATAGIQAVSVLVLLLLVPLVPMHESLRRHNSFGDHHLEQQDQDYVDVGHDGDDVEIDQEDENDDEDDSASGHSFDTAEF